MWDFSWNLIAFVGSFYWIHGQFLYILYVSKPIFDNWRIRWCKKNAFYGVKRYDFNISRYAKSILSLISILKFYFNPRAIYTIFHSTWFSCCCLCRVPVGLEDVSTYPYLLSELLRRGWAVEDLAKLAGLNVIRVLSQVEQVGWSLNHVQLEFIWSVVAQF